MSAIRPKLRVLVVDDSAFMRQLISNAVNSSDDMEVIALARNGAEAVTKAKELRPDVITLDIEMPVLSGLEALVQIMKETPTPVVMVSSLTVDGARETLQAFELGAIDVIPKPQKATATAELASAIAPKLRAAASVRLGKPLHRLESVESLRQSIELVVLGCSTGGPAALQEIIPNLPHNFPCPIVVAQHIPPGFTGPMAQRLDQRSQVRVVEAQQDMELLPGTVYIAPSGFHTLVNKEKGRVFTTVAPAQAYPGPFRPSINVLFKSAESFSPAVMGVILTGMGQDGLEGVKTLHAKGAHIVAEAEESAVIYGMPRAIVEAGLAHKVLHLQQVSQYLTTAVKK